MLISTQKTCRRRGVAILYMAFLLVLLMGIASLGVDLSRVRLAKVQLQAAADAAARAGAGELPNGSTSVQTRAIAVAAMNSCDGSAVSISNSNVTVGYWDTTSKTFTATNTNPNAVRVAASRTNSAGNAIPLLFGRFLGRNTCDANVSAIAMLTGTAPVQVPGWANPWLAGMPNGNYGGAAVSGTAPTNSPIQVTGITITPGGSITFQTTGSCADDPVNINKAWNPDGCSDGTGIRTNDSGYLNGMSQLTAQQGSLVGVFLGPAAPNLSAAPANLDMSSNGSGGMNYSTWAPALKQPFFIGDGKRTNGTTQQTITVPAGATRLFLGMHDNINWQNNSGYLIVSFNGTGTPNVITVK